jgi:hypothetical protein
MQRTWSHQLSGLCIAGERTYAEEATGGLLKLLVDVCVVHCGGFG